jgi:hypothetical protein
MPGASMFGKECLPGKFWLNYTTDITKTYQRIKEGLTYLLKMHNALVIYDLHGDPPAEEVV